MEVKELQGKIAEFMDKWAKKRKFKHSEQLVFNHLVEEVGELAREFVNRDKRKDKFSDEDLNNAIGDSLIHLVVLANLRGIDVEELVTGIIEEDSKRLLQ